MFEVSKFSPTRTKGFPFRFGILEFRPHFNLFGLFKSIYYPQTLKQGFTDRNQSVLDPVIKPGVRTWDQIGAGPNTFEKTLGPFPKPSTSANGFQRSVNPCFKIETNKYRIKYRKLVRMNSGCPLGVMTRMFHN